MTKRKRLFFWLKLLVSLALIAYFLLFRASLGDIGAVLRSASAGWLILSFSLHILGLLISALRWQILIKAQGDTVPIAFLARSYLVGTFFNNFLPSRIGGDVVRIWDGSKYSESKSLARSTAVILVERLTGIVVLLVFAAAASLLRLEFARRIPVIWAALLISLAGLALIGLLFLPLSGRLIDRLPGGSPWGRIKEKAADFQSALASYRSRPRPFFAALLWALLLQVNVVVHYWLIGKALHLSIPLLDYFIFIPIVHLILLIPVTINGLGLREVSYIEIFAFYGVAAGAAISFSLVDVAFMLIIGLVGGFIYILRK
jgi:uncharacterized protein (TIRG00374 family)